MEHQITDTLPRFGGSWFVGNGDAPAIGTQRLRQQFNLGRLARALATLERDKDSVMAHPPTYRRTFPQRPLEVGQQADMLLVVHPTIGEYPSSDGDQPTRDKHESGPVDRYPGVADPECVLANLRDDERHGRQAQNQHDPYQ